MLLFSGITMNGTIIAYSQKDSTAINLIKFFDVIEKYEKVDNGTKALSELIAVQPSILEYNEKINNIFLERKSTLNQISDSVFTCSFYEESIGFCSVIYKVASYYELFIHSMGESYLIYSYENSPVIFTITRLIPNKKITIMIKNNKITSYSIQDDVSGEYRVISIR